jgi:hypothetical protein
MTASDTKKPTLRGNRCQCTACGEYFNRVSTFDKHRTGAYDERRRCLSVPEMEGKGWKRNAAGFWTQGGTYVRA